QCWSNTKLTGEFRQKYDLRKFPFDQQRLTIRLLEDEDDLTQFHFDVDAPGSGFQPGMSDGAWQVDDKSFSVKPFSATYNTTFGDPSLGKGVSAYSGVQIQMTVKRSDWWTFWRLTTPVYVAAMLALLTFVMQPDGGSLINPRLALLAGLMFAVVL